MKKHFYFQKLTHFLSSHFSQTFKYTSYAFFLLFCIGHLALHAQENNSNPTENSPPENQEVQEKSNTEEKEITQKTNPFDKKTDILSDKGGAGELWFYPMRSQRPENDRHLIHAGERASLCLRLHSQSDFIAELKKHITGAQLILEDEETPPNNFKIEIGTESSYLQEGPGNCYLTFFRVPRQIRPGIYRIADLFLRDRDKNFVSMRNYLYEFSQADELEVLPAKEAVEEVQLLEIRGFDFDPRQQIEFTHNVQVKARHVFVFSGDKKEIPKNGLRVFYQLKEDEEEKGIYEAQCRPRLKTKNQFYCELKLMRPKSQWALRQIELALDSLYLEDKSGKLILSLQEPQVFEEKANKTPIKFIYFGVDR